jgi:hypothetical protein
LADLAKKRLRTKIPALRQALAGRFRPHHAFMVSQILAHGDYLDEVIATVSERVATVIAPFAEDLTRLDTIPGVNRRTAEVLISELGRGPAWTCACFHASATSRAGLCAQANTRVPVNINLGKPVRAIVGCAAALTEAALSASRSPNTVFAARYRRLKRHRGHKKAVIAVAHNLAVTVYYLLSRQSTYREIGASYLDRRYAGQVTRRAVQVLERQGYRVTIEPAA